ncbi:hypothetical protein VCV18_007600 [Metarhizium anisopliae]
MDLQRLTSNFLIGILDYILRPEPRPPFEDHLELLIFHFNRCRNLEFTVIHDVDVVFVEILRTAKVLDDGLRSRLNGLVNLRRPVEFILDDTQRIMHRLSINIDAYYLGRNPAYTGPVMTKLLTEVTEIVKAVFKFNTEDFYSCTGLYEIVAVGLLVRLCVSFTSIFGFKELPQFDLQGITVYQLGVLWRSDFADFIPKGSVSLFFSSIESIQDPA